MYNKTLLLLLCSPVSWARTRDTPSVPTLFDIFMYANITTFGSSIDSAPKRRTHTPLFFLIITPSNLLPSRPAVTIQAADKIGCKFWVAGMHRACVPQRSSTDLKENKPHEDDWSNHSLCYLSSHGCPVQFSRVKGLHAHQAPPFPSSSGLWFFILKVLFFLKKKTFNRGGGFPLTIDCVVLNSIH